MKQKKTGIFLLLAVVCMLAAAVFDNGVLVKADTEGYTYSFTTESSFTCGTDGIITAYTGSTSATEIIVPQTIGGVEVKGIGANVFAGLTSVTTIALPDTVTSFGDKAFSGCTALSTLYGYSKTSLTYVVIPYAESGIISIPSGLTSMGVGVFESCTSIGKFAVASTNTHFKTGTWESEAQTITDENGVVTKTIGEMLLSKDGQTLYRFAPAFHYTGEGLYALPEGIVTIAPYACEKVGLNGGFTIPTTVVVIGDYAFYSSSNINNIEFASVSKTSAIGSYAFASIVNLNITLPASVTSIGTYSFAYCSNIQIDISATQLTVIPDYAFYECDNLHTLTFPATLTKIGAYVFEGCDNLNEVIFLGDTLESIGTGAFKSCQNLHIIDIPEGVTEIAAETFEGCQNLNEIYLPDSLTTIGDNAFADCQNIHVMVIPAGVTYISSTSFSGVSAETMNNIDTSNNTYSQQFIIGVLPEEGTEFAIGDYKYTVTKSDETKGTVTLTGVTSKKLKTVVVDKTVSYKGYSFKVTAIGDSAFKGCKKLSTIKLGANVTKIGNKAFFGCKKLKTVKLNSKLKTIGNQAFAKCTSLKKITIPAKVNKIGKKAFFGCKKLKNIVIKSTKLTSKKVGSNAFKNIKSTAVIKVPAKKYSAYKTLLVQKGVSKNAKIKK